MKKRYLAILLVLAFTLGLAACSGGKDAKDWDYIAKKGEMIIGITYFEPMNYLDSAGELTGFETEFAIAVCEELGVKPKFQEISWAAKETELNAKNIDCIWNGMTINEERLANMSISQPYMQNKQVLIVKGDRAAELGASVDGKSIVAEAGSAGETVAVEEAFFANANFTAVDTQAKSLMEVSSGTADGCVVDYVVSIGMIGEGTDNTSLVVLEQHGFGEEEYGVAMRKEDVEFTKKLNDAINKLRASGKLKEIGEKYKLDALLVG
ncbi:MAG: transporter substrate-binding domain-containing protein [Clostridiales bacterium]|jgi:polar amino acid transport system substrate-binding protein|nr:transporter substrate-binding domain-containing protein [Clostridiales bacterium]